MMFEYVASKLNILLIVIIIAALTWQINRTKLVNESNEFRSLKMERLKLTKLIDILDDNQPLVMMASAEPSSVESITLSLIESVKAISSSESYVLHQLAVTQLEASAPQEQSAIVKTLSVHFSLSLHRAMDLLPVFDAIREVVAWRVSEVRGCELVRADAHQHELQASCTVDVYYYPAIDREASREVGLNSAHEIGGERIP